MERNLHDLLISLLRDLYDSEEQIMIALPKFIRQATNERLKVAFAKHLDQTVDQVKRLDKISQFLNTDLQRGSSKITRTLIEEANRLSTPLSGSDVKDAFLIAAFQNIEHYEIASYGTAMAWANSLGYEDLAGIMSDTLKEERMADELLTTIAEGSIFRKGINEVATASQLLAVI